MKEFLVGLFFIIAVFILAGAGVLLMPFFLLLAVFLRVILAILIIVFAIWLLGKSIVYFWEKIKKK